MTCRPKSQNHKIVKFNAKSVSEHCASFGAPQYSPLLTLREDIRASTVEIRDMKTKIIFVNHLLNSSYRVRLVRSIFY